MDPHALQSGDIFRTFVGFLAVAAVVWIAVVAVLAAGLWRQRTLSRDPLALDPPFEKRAGQIVLGLGIATIIIVLALSLVSYAGQRSVFAKDPNALTLKITGHQWWWGSQL
ncbi:hypothetical protein AB8Z38_35840 [Bradyrhizobium sp. LLZ17]|uniref:Cytochrome C oxidase subunit II n=1 Tax=Bradyrhizobium sp. LLZ17 TaxID=3239388 RepID=A0AB39XL72_9BRAD